MMTKKKRKITKIFNGYSLAIMCCLLIIIFEGYSTPKRILKDNINIHISSAKEKEIYIREENRDGGKWYVYIIPDKEDSKIKKQLSEVTKDNIEELKDKIALYYEWLCLEDKVIFDNNFKISQIIPGIYYKYECKDAWHSIAIYFPQTNELHYLSSRDTDLKFADHKF